MGVSQYVYLGIFFGMTGGALSAINDKKTQNIVMKVLAGGVVGALASVSTLGAEVSSFWMLSIVAIGYAVAGIALITQD